MSLFRRSRVKWLILGMTILWLALDILGCVVHYATPTHYFWAGVSGFQLHKGWHRPGWGFREQPPLLFGGWWGDLTWLRVSLPAVSYLLFWPDLRRPVLRLFEGRKYPPGDCQRCGYNLTGNISGVCPECGCPIPEAEADPSHRLQPAKVVLFLLLVGTVIFIMREVAFRQSLRE